MERLHSMRPIIKTLNKEFCQDKHLCSEQLSDRKHPELVRLMLALRGRWRTIYALLLEPKLLPLWQLLQAPPELHRHLQCQLEIAKTIQLSRFLTSYWTACQNIWMRQDLRSLRCLWRVAITNSWVRATAFQWARIQTRHYSKILDQQLVNTLAVSIAWKVLEECNLLELVHHLQLRAVSPEHKLSCPLQTTSSTNLQSPVDKSSLTAITKIHNLTHRTMISC